MHIQILIIRHRQPSLSAFGFTRPKKNYLFFHIICTIINYSTMALTNKQKYNKKVGQKLNESNSKEDISKKTRIPIQILNEVYSRGTGAWRNNIKSVRLKKDFSKNPNLKKYPRSARLTKEQWSYARVYSFVMEGRTTKSADKDLYNQVKNYKWFKKN